MGDPALIAGAMDGRPLLLAGALLAGPLLAGAVSASGTLKAQDPAPTLAPGAGVAVVQAKCTVCHPATMITPRRFTAQKWSDIVDQMISKGAQVSDEDYDVIVAYLTRAYGAGK